MPILTLLVRFWQPALVAVALGFGALMWHEHNVAEVEKGIAIQRAQSADSALKSLKPVIAKAETLYVHDTTRLVRTVARVDSLHDSVLVHLSDTIRVKEYVQASDSTIKACTSTLHDCAAVQSLLHQQISALEVKLAAQPIAQPRSCTGTGIVGALLGGAAVFAIRR